jgi:hypothetical protein
VQRWTKFCGGIRKVDGTGFKEIPSLVPSEKMKGSCFEDDNSNLWYDPRYV